MLKLSQKQTLKQLDIIIKDVFSQEETGHDYAHTKRVVNLTSRFVYPGVDAFVSLSIAYLHDVFDDKINKVDDLSTALSKFFIKHDLDFEGKEQDIKLGVSQIGYKGGFGVKHKTPEATLVSDADYLEAMGSIGIARTFYYAGSKGTPLFIGGLSLRDIDSLETYREESKHALAHLDEKLLKLVHLIESPKAKEIAARRHAMLVSFHDEFMLEMEEASELKI